MPTPVCRFYLQGQCKFGSSCRFLHSDDQGYRPNKQHYDEYHPRNNRYESKSHYGTDFDQSDNNYEYDGRNFNHHSKKDYKSRNNYDQRKDYNYYEDNYDSRNNYNDDYGSVNKHKSKKDYNSKNYHKDINYSENRNANSNYKYKNNSNYDDENNREIFMNDYEDNSRSNYRDDYGSLNKYKSNKDYNSKSYHKDINYSENRNANSNYKYKNNSNYDDENNREIFMNDYEDNYNSRSNYRDDYGSLNNYKSNKNYNSKNNYKDINYSKNRNVNANYKYTNNSTYDDENSREKFMKNDNNAHPNLNKFNHSGDHFNIKHNQSKVGDFEKRLKIYEKEIKSYQTHVKELTESNIWPFTCYHPIGNAFPIQPVGCLNFTEASFEEIRCDYYIVKSMCATPELIHKQSVENLMSRAQKQKENVLSSTDRVLNDLLATFDKCEQSGNDHTFVNCIQADNNSYWDMSIRELNKPKNTKSAIDSFSFVSNNGRNKDSKSEDTSLKIFMQNEIHGNMDCEAFEQEHFTDFIPIMPPPKKYCV